MLCAELVPTPLTLSLCVCVILHRSSLASCLYPHQFNFMVFLSGPLSKHTSAHCTSAGCPRRCFPYGHVFFTPVASHSSTHPHTALLQTVQGVVPQCAQRDLLLQLVSLTYKRDSHKKRDQELRTALWPGPADTRSETIMMPVLLQSTVTHSSVMIGQGKGRGGITHCILHLKFFALLH